MVREISATQLAERLGSSDPPLLIDVREGWEWDLARIQNARLMPLDEFARASASIPLEGDVVLYCHHGVRSLVAAQFLVTRGFTRVSNLTGGIDRYAVEADPQIPRY